MRILAPVLLAALAVPSNAAPTYDVAALREAAQKDDVAWDIVEGLTTEIGQRKAGSEAEARARDWAVARLKALGFANVHVEPFDMAVWERGVETAEITAPFPQKLVLTALGNSGATPPQGLTAEVVGFDTFEAFRDAPAAAVAGKIVFVSHAMQANQDGSGYGPFGAARRQGPSIASRKGAAAIVIRSIGTDHHRNPHTGVQDWADGATPIPAAALSIPDAEQLQRILKRGKPVTMRLVLTPRPGGMVKSGNVVAEVPGRDPKAGVVLVGGHLDSWDLGTGAIDDAAGVAIVTAAAKRIMDAGRPLHTIRVVWFGAEEVGLFGGKAYLAAHPAGEHALVAESDFGADKVWRIDTAIAAPAVQARLVGAVTPLGIVAGSTDKAGGSDITPLIDAGVKVVELQQDGTRYFDLHHTPDDTLDKVDIVQLRQNVSAWTSMLAVTSQAPELRGSK